MRWTKSILITCLTDELQRDENDTKVNQVRYSMPMSCAVQISLVALLADWDVQPAAVLGHSAGEMAAAYASGAMTLTEAMAASYYRGLVNAEHVESQATPTSGMLAVGLGPEQVKPYLEDQSVGRITIACYNSPESVTLSGDIAAIDHVEAQIKAAGGFARKLRVPAAFHSHHMEPLADRYEVLLQKTMPSSGNRTFKHGTFFYSAVTGAAMPSAKQVEPRLWVENMLQPVRFAQAFDQMMRDNIQVDMVLEVGPHSALAGPLRQLLAQPGFKGQNIGYGSSLERGKSAVDTMQNLAGMLVQLGHPLNVANVNFPTRTMTPVTIANLPTYPWNHKTKLWIESQQTHDRRLRPFPQHDLLGLRMPGLSDANATMLWRHVIRPNEIPWVRDHIVQSQIVYPGAGYIAMAIEAARQMHWAKLDSIRGYSLRDVEIVKALIVPDDADGAEVQLSLEGVEERFLAGTWRRFRISAAPGRGGEPWAAIATGLIQVEMREDLDSPKHHLRGSHDVISSTAGGKQTRGMTAKRLFETLQSYGVNHGPVFRNLHDDAIVSKGRASVSYSIADTGSIMPHGHQEPHVLHPTTLDSLFVATFCSFHASPGTRRKHTGGHVPRSIKQMFVSADVANTPGTELLAQTLLRQSSNHGMTVSAVAREVGKDELRSMIEIDNLYLQHIGQSDAASDASSSVSSADSASSDLSHLCLVNEWRRSFNLNKPDNLINANRMYASEEECRQSQDLIRATYYVVSDVLSTLTKEDVANMEPYHKKYHAWMCHLVQDAAAGTLGKSSAAWAKTNPGLKQRLIDNVAGRGPAGELAMRIGKNLLGILRKEISPLELMLEQKLLTRFYRDTVQVARTAQSTASFVHAIATENPCARILEIGAGTAGYTLPILQRLGSSTSSAQLFAHYTFTDISAGFFASAREELAPWGRHITFATLDIEKDLSEQGFELGSYDIVVAGQVLHATTNLTRTMSNVRSLLRDNGKLVMAETTRDAIEVSLIFGALPGWWLSEEPERWNGPNLSLESWDSYLKAVGFTGIDVSVWDCEQDHQRHVSSFVTTARPRDGPLLEKTATLLYDQVCPPEDCLRTLTNRFSEELGVALTVQALSSLELRAGGAYILLFDEHSSSQEFDEPMFNSMRSIVTTCQSLMCVTAGSAIEAEMPENSIHQGLLRTARLEDTSKRFVSLDLDPKTDRFSPENMDAVVKIFGKAMDVRDAEDAGPDQEFAVRHAEILVPRIVQEHDEHLALSTLLLEPEAKPHKFWQDSHHVRLAVEAPGLIDSLVFREDLDASRPLAEDMVEVKPHAFGLNFKDVMVVMGMLNGPNQAIVGCECAGIVSRIGPNCHNQELKVGDRVFCLTPQGQIATTARTPSMSVARIPDSLSFEDAAALPVVFTTAWYALFDIGRCEPEDAVLIHAAAGGVGQACIILAQLKGIKNLFVTVGTPEKRDFLRTTYGIPRERIFSSRDATFVSGVLDATQGRGVDVVINSLRGDLLAEGFKLLAANGRFVEIGKRDIVTNRSLDMEAFNRALSFSHVDVQQMSFTRGSTLQRIFKEILKLFNEDKLRCITPINRYPLAELPRAFRTMQSGQHTGKIVLVPTHKDVVSVSVMRTYSCSCSGFRHRQHIAR